MDPRPETTPGPEARSALAGTLHAWSAELAVPTLRHWGVTTAAIPALVADARGSSMRTNPIVLTDDELAGILAEAI